MSGTYECVHDLSEIRERKPTCLAVGVFDGVHRGHQYLLQEMVREARALGAVPAVLTFFPHPKVVIQGLSGRLYLTTVEERARLLGAQGAELVIVHPFNQEVRHMRAAAFVERLCEQMALRQMWGGSFSLGYQREGDYEFLSRLGEEKGFTVHLLEELVMWNGERVSSSRIRAALAEGDIETVNGGLGRPFSLIGTVVEGDRRGQTIGFPTANLAVWEQQLLPANGVYATYVWLGEERYVAATNVGVRPTVDGASSPMVEPHLLDFERNIYGEQLRVEFMARIRDERKFPGLDALKAQIAADVAEVRTLLGSAPRA